jgi:hypothetical protein
LLCNRNLLMAIDSVILVVSCHEQIELNFVYETN